MTGLHNDLLYESRRLVVDARKVTHIFLLPQNRGSAGYCRSSITVSQAHLSGFQDSHIKSYQSVNDMYQRTHAFELFDCIQHIFPIRFFSASPYLEQAPKKLPFAPSEQRRI
jgi:hypothetical protein